jgi:hypothetical protein
MAGTLQLNRFPGDWGHLCGHWGCGPSVKALIVWHLFWLVSLSLPAVLAISCMSRKGLRRLGLAVISLGILGTSAVLAVETMESFSQAIRPGSGLLVARCLFRLATLVDLPLVQGILLGGLCWAVASVSGRADVPFGQSQSEPL